MPAPRVLLLDLDGTLVDATEAIVDGVLALAAEAGLAVPERAWVTARLGHDPARTWALMGASDPVALVDAFTDQWIPRLAERTAVLPGVGEALAALAAAGHVLAVATTRLTESAVEALAVTGLSPFITHVTGRDLVARPKPAPDVLLHALAAVGGTPDGALMIGDSDADVLAATAAGLPCWAVLGGTSDESTLRGAGAARILSGGLGELPAALGSPRDGGR